MSNSLTLPSPAKLNLFLHITGRRADGYHELQTLFQLLDWGDTLTFQSNNSGQITLSGAPEGVAEQDNLVVRAAQLLCAEPPGVHIALEKRIPMGGGLGGGSSNAATTLLALNHLWQLNLTVDDLAGLGAKLGADVPVFVRGRSAWAEGVGEELTPIELPPTWYVIIAPNCHVSTAQIFSHEQLTRNSSPIKMAAFSQRDSRNDCQDLVRQLYPEVDKALFFLDKFGDPRLTGTGGCIFASFATEAEATRVQAQIPDHWRSYVARGVNRSGVSERLA